MNKVFSIVVLVGVAGTASAEIIGGYAISATPVSAQEIVGGGGIWSSLNIVNVPLSINDAFSGSPLADDGYANGQAGVTVQCTFAVGDLVNGSGPDLLFVDSRYSDNSYNIYIGNDGFTVPMFAGGAGSSGDTRDYYYGGGGPYRADLIVYAFDLSSWGVAPGGVVTDVRFVGLSDQVDPIGFGSINVPAPGALAALGMGALFAGRRRR